jgi:hypothetical protein
MTHLILIKKSSSTKGEKTFRELLELIDAHPAKEAILDSVLCVSGQTRDIHVNFVSNTLKYFIVFDTKAIEEGEELLH